ncbi:hypothetical protein M885DRAFT_153651 [Pelagophyceae sp. CCMP2097]|nr:hypothetical protein M885DRAFT_153651 [Pelagophyceae sp. CCMP2097]
MRRRQRPRVSLEGGGGGTLVMRLSNMAFKHGLASFARLFKRVVAIEIDAHKATCLRHNLGVLRGEDAGCSIKLTGNFEIITGNCLETIPTIVAAPDAVVFADPPWGGRHYGGGAEGGAETGDGGTTGDVGDVGKAKKPKNAPKAAASAAQPDSAAHAAVHLKGGGGSLGELVRVCSAHGSVRWLLLKVPSHFDHSAFLNEKATKILVHSHAVSPLRKLSRNRAG